MADETNSWLEDLGLGRYAAVFAEQEITLDALWHLTDDDLKELGLPLGPRRIVSAAIADHLNADQRPSPPVAASPAPAVVVEPERRQLTVMFCDLVGSTVLAQRLDPEDYRDVLRQFHDAVTEAIATYNGYIAQYLGDGVLAYFGWPQASENQAESAVWAGLSAIRAIEDLTAGDGVKLEARIGIASGLVIVGDLVGEMSRDPQTVTGETPNLAARLQALASPGEVVIDTGTRAHVAAVFALEDYGLHDLKGFFDPVPVWKVVGEGSAENRFEAVHADSMAPFVGRNHELGLVRERWDIAKSGEGQVVLFSGEPGMGKSRFLEAFRKLIAGEQFIRMSYQCSPHHQSSALFPAIQQLRRIAGMTQQDSTDERLDKLEAMLGGYSNETAETLQLFASLLSLPAADRYGELKMSPQQLRERTIDALVSQLIETSRDQPVLFILEDAHWIDPTTEMLVSEAMQRIGDAAVLMLVTYRPSYEPPWPSLANQAKLFLNRLSRGQSEQIVEAIGGDRIPAAAAAEIVARSDGIPLFVEELAKSLIESGDFDDIPGSLQVLLVSRIDRLGDAKKVLQVASVIGRPFDLEFIQAVGDYQDAELEEAIAAIIDAGLVVRTTRELRTIFRFKHALIQDVAYKTLLRSRRREYHGKVAEILLRDGTGDEVDDPELVAWHLSMAKLLLQSTEYWLRAGRRAGQKSAHLEAIANLEKGLRDLSELPESSERDQREFDIRTVLGASLLSLEGWSAPKVAQNYARARELSENSGDVGNLFIALRGQANVFFLNGRIGKAFHVVRRLVDIAEEREETALMLDAYRSAGMCELFSGAFEQARDKLHQANGLYDRDEHHSLAYVYGTDPAVLGKVCLAWAHWFLGATDEADREAEEAITLALELKHPFSLAYAHCLSASLHQFRRQPEAVIEHAEAASAIAVEHDYTYWQGWAGIMHGWAEASLGEPGAGIERLKESYRIYKSTGAKQIVPYILTLLAEMQGWAGSPRDGLRALTSVLDPAGKNDVRFFRAESLRIAAELSHQGEFDKIGDYLDEAVAQARKQGAVMLELRALTSALRAGRATPEQVERLRVLLEGMAEGDDPDRKDAREALEAAG